PEIQKHGSLTSRPLFVPSVGSFAQGMIVSLPLQLWSLPGKPKPGEIHEALASHYADESGSQGITVASLEESASAKAHPLLSGTSLDAEMLSCRDGLT